MSPNLMFRFTGEKVEKVCESHFSISRLKDLKDPIDRTHVCLSCKMAAINQSMGV